MQDIQEIRVQSLGGEDPLEKEIATHCDILAQKIPWAEEPGGLQSVGLQRVGHNWAHAHLHTLTHTHSGDLIVSNKQFESNPHVFLLCFLSLRY